MRARVIAVVLSLMLLAVLVGVNVQAGREYERDAASAAASLPSSTAGVPNGRPELSIDVADIEGHLAELQTIADEHDGTRAAGTPGYDASVDYVERVLHQAGYQTQWQAFEFSYDGILEIGLDLPGATDDDIVMQPLRNSAPTPPTGLSGELLVAADGTGCTSTAYDDPSAAIVIAARGGCTFREKAQAATDAGAAALLVYNTGARPIAGTLGSDAEDLVPSLTIGLGEGQDLLARAGTTATLRYLRVVETRTTYNLIAQTPTGSDDDVLMLGAHLDSVPTGPGINDNGSGSAMILELAVQLAVAGPLVNSVRFAWWGAEELGLFGSAHYVEDLRGRDAAALEEIALYVNADMVGSPNYVIGVYDADSSTYPADVGLTVGSVAGEALLTSYFDQQGQPWIDIQLDGTSDYQAFTDAGVPVAGLFTGASGTKTAQEAAQFGGTAGEPYDPGYHTPQDDLTNIDPDALHITGGALAHLVAAVSYDASLLGR